MAVFMIVVVGAYVASAVILWLLDKSNRDALGLLPNWSRIKDLAFGFTTSAGAAALALYAVALVTGATLALNPDFGASAFFDSSLWMLRSVLLEELLFRGPLLYVAIRLMGINRACILSSVAFGVYHWFSYQVLGDATAMMYVFLLTGIGGLLFAYSFALTKSLYLPVGFHLGWNLVSVVIFSQGPLGDQLLIASGGGSLGAWAVVLFIYQVTLLPVVAFLYLRKEISLVNVQDVSGH